MTDNMDKLLFDIGHEANAGVDFSRTLGVLLKEQEKQRKKKVMMYRYCGAAAAVLVLLVGTTALMPKMGKAEAEAAPAAEAPMEYAVAQASFAADEAAEERMIETETTAEECAPAEEAAPMAPEPAEGGVAGIDEYPAAEEASTGGAPLAPPEETEEAAEDSGSSSEVVLFEGVYYAAVNPAFEDPAVLERMGLPAEITPDMVGDEIGSAVSINNGEPFPVYACPGIEVSGVLIMGGDTFLVPATVLGEGVE